MPEDATGWTGQVTDRWFRPRVARGSRRHGHREGMKCYSVMLGANRVRSERRTFSREDEALIRELTARHFPEGYTILNAEGGWFDPSRGRFIKEASRQILICTADRRRVRRWGHELGAALRQKELLIVQLGSATTLKVRSQ